MRERVFENMMPNMTLTQRDVEEMNKLGVPPCLLSSTLLEVALAVRQGTQPRCNEHEATGRAVCAPRVHVSSWRGPRTRCNA